MSKSQDTRIVFRNITKIRIQSVGLFIDYCKKNNLDHKKIILDIVKEAYENC